MAKHPAPASPNTTPDPDLNKPPPTKLLAIDWKSVAISSDADANALWQQIAPTGEDWEAKLDEIPTDGPIGSQLALALLRGGNFACAQSRTTTCGASVQDIETPGLTATLADPCLRRMLALWALSALDDVDVDAARDALRMIARLPPPESQLVDAALDVLPETEHAGRLELRALAFAAGHRELVNGKIGSLDEPYMIEAVLKHHIDGPLDILSAESHRSVFLGAIGDELLHPGARAQAMIELAAVSDAASAKLPADARAALVKATRSSDCSVAATAARVLVARGDKKLAPIRPRAQKTPPMMRALCVLASYEQIQRADEASYLPGYIPQKGLEVVTVSYDPYSDTDHDGDGNVHTERTTTLLPRGEVVLPELEDLVRALKSCKDTTCTSADRTFKLGLKPGPGGDLLLARIEVVERPPCPLSN